MGCPFVHCIDPSVWHITMKTYYLPDILFHLKKYVQSRYILQMWKLRLCNLPHDGHSEVKGRTWGSSPGLSVLAAGLFPAALYCPMQATGSDGFSITA